METPLLKIDSIRRCISRVKEIVSQDPDVDEINTQDLIVLNIQRACEQAIDLANWICAFRNLSIPRTSREVFSILENERIITQKSGNDLRKMVGFRNIAIHEYQKLNKDILKSIVFHRLADFETFIDQISANLQLHIQKKQQSESEKSLLTPLLRRVSLKGGDLGNDYKIELNLLGQVLSVEVKIQSGETKEINKTLAHFLAPSLISQIPVNITVKELDPIYNDVGADTVLLTSSLDAGWDQILLSEICVQGSGGREKNRTAFMSLEVDFQTCANSLQLVDSPPNGWIVALTQQDVKIQLPAGLRIKYLENKNDREVFEIQEGPHKGGIASISVTSEGLTHFRHADQSLPGCKLQFNRKTSILTIGNLGDFLAATRRASEELISGNFMVSIPDLPHKGGRKYRPKAKHAETWFKIGQDGDSYLHPGTTSRGCITILDIDKWEGIYQHLIAHRLNDTHIGIIEIF